MPRQSTKIERVCPTCGKTYSVYPSLAKKGYGLHCSQACNVASRPQESRFWSKIDQRGGPDACWPWTGGRFTGGYGAIHFDGRLQKAHRVALVLSGTPVPDDMLACHVCNFPPCCNPAHLYAGTTKQNAEDCVRSGRKNPPRGERQWMAYLTAEDVDAIRSDFAAGKSVASIARERGIPSRNVGAIVRGITWKHLPSIALAQIDATPKERRGGVKLNADIARDIRARFAAGELDLHVFARELNVSWAAVKHVVIGKTWKEAE